MKKHFIEAILISLLITHPNFLFAQSAKDAVMTFKKLEARVQVGISYRDYQTALGDAQFAVNQFLESPEAKKSPEMAKVITTVLNHFKMAAVVWNFSIRSNRKFLPWDNPLAFGPNSDYKDAYDLAHEIVDKYPKAKDVTIARGPEDRILPVDQLIMFFWGEASKELKQTNLFLQKLK